MLNILILNYILNQDVSNSKNRTPGSDAPGSFLSSRMVASRSPLSLRALLWGITPLIPLQARSSPRPAL